MNSLYSTYMDIDEGETKEKILEILDENNIEVEKEDVFNSDFAIVKETLNYSFPHIVVSNTIENINSNQLFKYDGIDFILKNFDEDLIRLKIQNAIYFVMARGSRGAFKQRIKNELEKLNRSGGSFSLALVSVLDFYKHKNNLSSIELDETVKDIYKMIKISTRKSDEVMKISRKEFGILLPFTELRNAEIACERIKRRSNKIKSSYRNISLAFGITEVSNPNEDLNKILEKLKKALYISEGNRGDVAFL
ncbi:diguanylate cyclase [Oceanotoga sp. DSM 15011]|uniref:diguanylate cyclase domain-containing protein n=1 Tax=Oceanotoga sp. DSM 15011 TaxID=2984951 RepID=UPI0021F4F47D|nr:diguanylate cyclase [Oceanotoga sp. DSM 15011]UYP00096.1 diguanylate cyclase [Oceanotoga sp. DSM 15011]